MSIKGVRSEGGGGLGGSGRESRYGAGIEYVIVSNRPARACRQHGILSHAASGVSAAKSGIHGVNSSAWFPIRNDFGGNGGLPPFERAERRIAGGDREVTRRSGAGE